MPKIPNFRFIAAQIIDEVTQGASLAILLPEQLSKIKDPRDRAFVQALTYGVCRFYYRLDAILGHLLKKPMKSQDGLVHALLLVGLFQLIEMRIPPHAAVAETVNATKSLKKTWARGFVNAILREYLRQETEIQQLLKDDLEYKYAHPSWWIKFIQNAWPQYWEEILVANNAHPPFSLRVNQKLITREKYLEKLSQAQSIPETRHGIILLDPQPVEALPGFAQGEISVQDAAAQLASELLELKPAQRVLDACAAPGGKLTHILEIEPNLAAVIAIDKDAERLKTVSENLKRLNLKATEICADVSNPKKWWDGELFDRILLDAPCSASGVIRRHPDIKLLRQPTDIKQLSKEQAKLLSSLWPLLKPGGMLLYTTCSIFPEENAGVLKAFLDVHQEAEEVPLDVSWGIPSEIGRQILPGMREMDGFYYARLRKRST